MKHLERVLVYLASGPHREEYAQLPYDKVILIDYNAFDRDSFGTKVECWRCNVIEAVERFSQRNLKISCLVNINEGLQEGGGSFVMLSDFMMGYLSPMLRDEFTLVTNLAYYRSVHIYGKMKKLDWGFDFNEVSKDEPDFIDPWQFSHYAGGQSIRKEGFGQVFRLRRIQKSKSLPLNPALRVSIKQESIWMDTHKLDAIGVSISSQKALYKMNLRDVRSFFLQKENTLYIRGLSMLRILDYCESHKIRSIGLMPWCDGDYTEAIEAIVQHKAHYLKEITFYHLSKGDYKELYNYAQNNMEL
jgi:hypothetical protein